MKNLSLKYIPFGLLCAYALKSLITGAGLNEVLVIGILASLTGFYESKLSHKRFTQLQEESNKRFAELQIDVDNKIKVVKEHNNIQDKKIEDLQASNISSKLSTSLRGLAK